jgi:hypothetical protein
MLNHDVVVTPAHYSCYEINKKKLYSSDCQLQLIVIVTITFPVNFSFFVCFFG